MSVLPSVGSPSIDLGYRPEIISDLIDVLKKRLDVVDLVVVNKLESDDYDIFFVDFKEDDRYPDGLDLIWLKSQSPTVSMARTLDKLITHHTIILCNLPPTAQFKKNFLLQDRVEIFVVEEITRKIFSHGFLPPFVVHRGVTDSSILPKIEQDDILCRLLNLRPNDVIEFSICWGDFDMRKMKRIVV